MGNDSRPPEATSDPPILPPGSETPSARRGLPTLRWLVDFALRHDGIWIVLSIFVLVALTWHSPWSGRIGELVEGRIADGDIVAPIDVEIPDEAQTAERRGEARGAVDEVYVFDPGAGGRLDQSIQEGAASGQLPGPPEAALALALRRETSGRALEALRQIARAVLSEMIVARVDTLPRGRSVTVEYFGERREVTLRDLGRIIDLEEAKRRAREAAARIPGLDPAAAGLAGSWIASLVQPTLTYDLGETQRRREEAARQVPVLYSRLPKGKVLVRKGQPLTRDSIREIEAMRQASPRGFDPTGLLGLTLVFVFVTFFLWRYASDARRFFRRVRYLFPFLVLTLLLHALLAEGVMALIDILVNNLRPPFDRPETLWYLIPTASGAVLVSLLANDRIATVYSLFAGAVFAILFDWNLPYALFAILTHLAGVYGVARYHARSALIKSGMVVGFTGAAVAAGLDAVKSGFSPWQVGLADALFAFLGGAIGVPLVVSFLMPIFEWLFEVLTDVRLLELSNLDNPLLSELALRAPGSYNHSIIVGTLAESAAEAIGANALFCRVAAFYHDIGKMKMPEYYIENQKPGENPHDRLSPSMSALILSNHVKEGIRLGREHGLPEAILEIIPQHHGTRVMTFFYEKAKVQAETSGSPPPSPDDYRHPGPKPSSKEGAIFMLADSVEAAARTVGEPDAERYRDMIRQIAGRAILDGQFDQCDLTFRDLDKISEAFIRTLASIYHRRIDYPTFIFEGGAGSRRAARGRREAPPRPGADETA